MREIKKILKMKYDAQGFVEALIAIAITGIAGIVLLSIATKTVNQTIYNEIQDEITLANSNMALKLEYLIQADQSGDLTADSPVDALSNGYPNQCVMMDFTLDNLDAYEITTFCSSSLDSDGLLSRSDCNLDVQDVKDFAFVCPTASSSNFLTVDIISGSTACTGRNCRDYVNTEVYLLK